MSLSSRTVLPPRAGAPGRFAAYRCRCAAAGERSCSARLSGEGFRSSVRVGPFYPDRSEHLRRASRAGSSQSSERSRPRPKRLRTLASRYRRSFSRKRSPGRLSRCGRSRPDRLEHIGHSRRWRVTAIGSDQPETVQPGCPPRSSGRIGLRTSLKGRLHCQPDRRFDHHHSARSGLC